MNNKYYWLIGGIVLGIVLQPQISKIPGISKIPSL
jgi:hypothetical protein